MENLFVTIFELVGMFYSLVLPLLLLFIMTLIFIASMQQPGAKAKQVGEAIYSYLMQTVGVILMTIGALPTIYSVLSGRGYSSITYLGLLMVFSIGGVIFLWHDHHEQAIDTASKAVPGAIYFYMFKILGHLLTIFAGLSLLLTIIFSGGGDPEWWMTPMIMLFYGLLLCWCTTEDSVGQTSMFKTIPMSNRAAAAKNKAPKAMKKKRKTSRRSASATKR